MTISSPYTVIYAFGDSLSDAGDASLLTNSAAGAAAGLTPTPVSPPYATENYAGGVSAAVFSNGPVWVQDLAADLGLPTLAPASVGTVIPQAGYVTLVSGAPGGTDFAIGGSVTGVTNENGGSSVPLTDLSGQITNFQNQVAHPAATALYTVWSGSNDILNLLEDPNFATLSVAAINADIAQSVQDEAAAIQTLITLGATNLLVLDVPDLGHVPAITYGYPSEVAQATSLAASFDNSLNALVSLYNKGAVHVAIEDTYALLDDAEKNPAAYKLSNVTSEVYSGSLSSYDPKKLVSSDPSVQNTYLFFDQQHPTETGHRVIEANALAALGLACFAEGTLIQAARGMVAVETLRVGDRLPTAGGIEREVTWTGHRRIDCGAHPDPRAVWPVRVRAGAFGPSTPSRDLLLSPDHAVFAGGALIPVRYLIDGDAIAQVEREAISYWHVELDAHDAILAEGLSCESYLDTGQRAAFAGGAVTALHPDFSSLERDGKGFAPLVVSGPALEAVRRHVAAQRATRARRFSTLRPYADMAKQHTKKTAAENT